MTLPSVRVDEESKRFFLKKEAKTSYPFWLHRRDDESTTQLIEVFRSYPELC
jgi:hypothetical protein